MNLDIIWAILIIITIISLFIINKTCRKTKLYYEIKYDEAVALLAKEILEKDKYKQILDSIPEYIWCRNKNFEVIYSNKRESLEQLINCSNTIIHEARKKNHSISKIQNIIIGGKPFVFKVKEIPTINNKNMISVGIAYDISESENEKKELSGHIAMYRDMLESSSHAIAFYAIDRRLIFYNDVFVKLWSLDSNWLDTKPLYDEIVNHILERKLISPDDINEYKKEQAKIFYSLINIHNDFLYLPSGKIIRLIIAPNNFGGLLFSYEDITDRLIIEHSYNNLIKVTKGVIDSIHEAAIVFDKDTKLYLYNNSYMNLWEFEKQYLDSKPYLVDIITDRVFATELLSCISSTKNKTFTISLKEKILELRIVHLSEGFVLFLYNDITDYCAKHDIKIKEIFQSVE